ncbi:MAG: hypothetical protein Unbinned465contig1000_23 [Prokaryotic dsDNA virus sp.]|mgnify:FL=1|nr:MAG: hypothetical protein Unbinned465contig1000_23 [Prokaryotic dsDNA virus sp.]
MASPVQTFVDFMNSTGPSYMTSAQDVVNEAVKNTYVFSRLLKEKADDKTIQGGTEIRDVVMFDENSTYQHYQPNEVFSWSNPQVTDTITQHWRFSIDHLSFTDSEIELNFGEGLSGDGQKGVYKRLKRIKEQRMMTSMLNGMETDLFRPTFGNATEMEGANGKLPSSIPSFITEKCIDATSVTGRFRGGRPLGYTGNVMGVDPTTELRWTNEVVFYNKSAAVNAGAQSKAAGFSGHYNASALADGSTTIFDLFGAFDEMFLRLQYVPPSTQAQYFEDNNLNRQIILCSREGINQYKRLLRASNNTLISAQDPQYNSPTYSGIELMYCSELDTAKIYDADVGASVADTNAGQKGATPDGADAETADDTINKGARYYFVNFNYLHGFFHANRYMVKHEVMRHPNQPFTYVQPTDTWYNLFCGSRQRQGIVAPVAIA